MICMRLLEIRNIKGDLGVIHFVGIGGIGISAIAEIMHNLGYKVQGSDLCFNQNTKRLEEKGIKIFEGHEPLNIADASYVVISTAVKEDNPEVQAAIDNKIPVISRAEMLAEIMKLKTSIAISGSHGKTTTTALTACMFEAAGLGPTVITGGIINGRSTNAYIGKGDYMIVEADESDATFIKIPSTIAVITNIDPEHMDFYETFDNLKSAFVKFIHNLPFYGFAVACIDNVTVKELVNNIKDRKVLTYGAESENANIRAYNVKLMPDHSIFDVRISSESGYTSIEGVFLPMPGMHNVLNALSAIAIASELDFGIKNIKNGFRAFGGVKRRFTKTGEHSGVIVIDDYAHHPEEVISTLKTARNYADSRKGRVVAVFQPHRYSRLSTLFSDFVDAFIKSDKLLIAPVYAAGEAAIDGYDHHVLTAAVTREHSRLAPEGCESFDDIAIKLYNYLKPNDVVIFMGAGNITQWANDFPKRLAEYSSS